MTNAAAREGAMTSSAGMAVRILLSSQENWTFLLLIREHSLQLEILRNKTRQEGRMTGAAGMTVGSLQSFQQNQILFLLIRDNSASGHYGLQ